MTVDDEKARKTAQRAMWEKGDYARTKRDLLEPLGRRLVESCSIKPGQRVLDVGAGSGNAAIPAAAAGARVVASDLSPKLLETGRREATDQGIALEWVEADAETLPFEDEEFDVVMSCIGAMFAPDHRQVADEMLRVCRPGGTIGMLNWASDGSVAEFFQVFAPYLPPLPPGATPALKWGDPDYVRDLFGDRIGELTVSVGQLQVDHFADPEAFRDYYKANFGPTITAYAGVADEPERLAALDSDLLEYARRTNRAPEGAHAQYGFDYLVMTTRKQTD